MKLQPGHIQHIKNTDRRFAENTEYYLMYATDNEAYMFTDDELAQARLRARNNTEDTARYPMRKPTWLELLKRLFA